MEPANERKNSFSYSKIKLGMILFSFLLVGKLSNVSGFFDSKQMMMVLFNVTKHDCCKRLLSTFWSWFHKHLNSLVVPFESIHTILFITIVEDMEVMQFDIKTTFLHGAINKDNDMIQVPRFEDQRFLQHVYHLKKSMYDRWKHIMGGGTLGTFMTCT